MKTLRLLSLCALWAASTTIAAGAGIKVTGTGETQAKPDRLEIALRPAGSAELTGDAIVKFRDSMRRVISAFEGLKMDNLKVEARELTIGQGAAGAQAAMMAQMGNDDGAAKLDMEIAQRLVVRLDGIAAIDEASLLDAVAKVLDTAKDSGAAPTPEAGNPMVRAMLGNATGGSAVEFIVSDPRPSRREALKAALADARAQAEDIAALAGAKLGPVISVAEIQNAESPENVQAVWAAMYGVTAGSSGSKRLSSQAFGPLTVRMTLEVEFALEEAKP